VRTTVILSTYLSIRRFRIRHSTVITCPRTQENGIPGITSQRYVICCCNQQNHEKGTWLRHMLSVVDDFAYTTDSSLFQRPKYNQLTASRLSLRAMIMISSSRSRRPYASNCRHRVYFLNSAFL